MRNPRRRFCCDIFPNLGNTTPFEKSNKQKKKELVMKYTFYGIEYPLIACPGMLDHIQIKGLNHID